MVKKKYSKKEIFQVVTGIGVALGILTFYIWHQAEIIRFGYQIRNSEEVVLRLKEDINKLEIQKSSLLSLENVEKIAREKLGLEDPKPGQVIFEDYLPIS